MQLYKSRHEPVTLAEPGNQVHLSAMATLIDQKNKSQTYRHPEKRNRPDTPVLRKPNWIRVKAPMGKGYLETRDIVKSKGLVTVC